MSTYPKANRTAQWYSNTYSSATFKPNCVVVHSTETTGWPGYNGGSMAPNMTGKPNFAAKTIDWRAHFEDEESSRALVNLSGGVETNTACAIQWELVGTCDPKHRTSWNGQGVLLAGRDYIFMPDAPDWYLKAIADVVAYYNRKHGIKVQSGLKWNAYPGSYGATADRLTFTEWRNFYGYCGHQHVPENDHGDPGNFPIQKALDKAKALLGAAPAPTPAPAPQEDDMFSDSDRELLKATLNKADGETLRKDQGWQNAMIQANFTALTTAVQTLATAQGVDASQIADVVDKAVRDRLSQIKITDAPSA